MLKSQTFDVIILDNTMPVMTGLEFLEHLHQRSQQSDAPIIMITGFLTHEVREKATKLGVYTIVSKPFDLGEFRALVGQLCLKSPSLPQESPLLPKESS